MQLRHCAAATVNFAKYTAKNTTTKNIPTNLCVWSNLKCFSQLSPCHEAIDKRPIAAKVTPLSRLMSILKNFRDFEIYSLCCKTVIVLFIVYSFLIAAATHQGLAL